MAAQYQVDSTALMSELDGDFELLEELIDLFRSNLLLLWLTTNLNDRSLINQQSFGSGQAIFFGRGEMMVTESEGSGGGENHLDKIVVEAKETGQLGPTAEVIKKILDRRHQGVEDYEIKMPELLLKQEQKTKGIFNIVLAAIAAISLIA